MNSDQNKQLSSIMPMTPFFVDKVWGSPILAKLKNYSGEKLGETWEVAAIKEGASLYKNIPLRQIFSNDTSIPFILKIIGTSDYLSVQVHPNNDWAKKLEGPNQLGKSECWLILDCQKDSGIYLGLKKGVTKEDLEKKIKSSSNVNDLLNFIPVKKGDFYFVPAGTIHAIGKNLLLAEVQQASGITYRIWDWNRPDKRELHIDKALQVSNFNYELPYYIDTNLSKKQELIKFENLSVNLIKLENESEINLDLGNINNIHALMVLNGEIEIESNDKKLNFKNLETALLPSLNQSKNSIKIKNKTKYSSFLFIKK